MSAARWIHAPIISGASFAVGGRHVAECNLMEIARMAAGYTLLVASAGGIFAARRAGAKTANWPSTHNNTRPSGR